MPLDFPASPGVNDTYTFSGRTWKWNGEGWQLTSDSSVTTAMLADGAVTNAKVSATAAIAGSKITPNFSDKTDAVSLASGTTAQRPGSPSNGMVRYNSTLGCMESYVQGAWQVVANTTLDYGLITSSASTTFDYGALS